MANGSTTVGSIDVRFGADADGVEREAKKAERAIEGVGNSVKGLDRVNSAGRRAAQELRREYEKAFAGTSQASNAATRKFLANADNIIAKNEIAVGRLQAGDIKRLLSRQKIARQIEAIENKIASRSDRGLDTSVQEQQLNDVRQRQRVAIIEQRNADDQRIKDINTFVQGTDKALGNFRKMAQVEAERSEKSQRDLARLQIDAQQEDAKRIQAAEKRQRDLARLQIDAQQEDAKRTRDAEQAQRRLARLQIEALKEDEKRTQQANRMAQSTRRTTGYLRRQLRALRDFFVRYATIIALFAAPAAAAGLARVSITGGEDFIVRQRQLEALIGTYGDFAVAQQRIQSASDATRTSFQQTTDIFETLFLQFQDMPFAIERTAAVTEGINLLFRGSAASAEEMSRAIVQLRQGFAKGVFSAQDTRILTEQIRLFDDFLRAAGLPIGQRISADRLRVALAGGAGRGLVEERAGAIDTRISTNARRVADAFQRASASALEQSGLLGAVNFGLEYFETLLQSSEFEQWLSDVYDRGTAFVGVLIEAIPEITDFGERVANAGFRFVGVIEYLVSTIVNYSNIIQTVISGFVGASFLGSVGTNVAGGLLPRKYGGQGVLSNRRIREWLKLALPRFLGTGGAALAGIGILQSVGRFLGATASNQFAAISFDDSLLDRGRGLLTAQGELRYSAIDAEIRRRGQALDREEAAVIELTQAYRALGKAYRDVFNIEPVLTFEDRLDTAVILVEKNLEHLQAKFSDALGGIDVSREKILGLDFSNIDLSTEEGIIDAIKNLGGSFNELDIDLRGILGSLGIRAPTLTIGEREIPLTDTLVGNVELVAFLQEIAELQRLYEKGIKSADGASNSRELFRDSLIELFDAQKARPIPNVDRRQFVALASVLAVASRTLDRLINQRGRRELDKAIQEAREQVEEGTGDIYDLAVALADRDLATQRASRIRRLESRVESEEIKAIFSGDRSAVEAAQLELDIVKREADVTKQLADANRNLDEEFVRYTSALDFREGVLADLDDAENAYVKALRESRLSTDSERDDVKKILENARKVRDEEREKVRILEETRKIADESTLAGYKKRLDTYQKLVDLLSQTEDIISNLTEKEKRIREETIQKYIDELNAGADDGKKLADIFDFDFIDVLAQRALGQQVDTEQNRLDFLSQFGGLNVRRRAQLENDLFLRQQQAAARLALESSKRIFGGDSDEVREATERLERINEALTGQNPLVRQNIEAWTQARIAQLEFADEQERINTGLNNLARVSQFAVESLRDGFISAIDEAERFSDVLHSIALGFRNLVLDIAIFEPFERGLRSLLQNSFLTTVTQPRQSGALPLGNFIGGVVGTGTTVAVNNYSTNVLPPAAAWAYEQQQDQVAVGQALQIGRAVFGLLGGRA